MTARLETGVARRPALRTVLLLGAALLWGSAGIILAYHYPVMPTLAVASFLLCAGVSLRWPSAWLVAIPALLPIVGFATWTGWFTFEELDLLVLAAACGGYVRIALTGCRAGGPRATLGSLAAMLAVALLAVSYAIALARGVMDAGGLAFDWIGSYESPMNSIRIGKSLFLALLLWPMLRWSMRRDENSTVNRLAVGLALGLACAALAALWERAAFTDVLNFSTDYRTTALFWEMHVGGAAFDGFLALTVPFAVWMLRGNPGYATLGGALGLIALAAYACLTTFSRGVYLGAVAELATLGWLLNMQRSIGGKRMSPTAAGRLIFLCVAGTAALYLVFRHGGYRATLAFVAVAIIALCLGEAGGHQKRATTVLVLLAGLVAGTIASAVALFIPKGPYLLFAGLFVLNVVLCTRRSASVAGSTFVMQLLSFVALAVSASTVALHWGGMNAFVDSAAGLTLMLCFGVATTFAPIPMIARDMRSRGMAVATLAGLAAGIAVFGGGAYMADRFSTSSDDFGGRLRHWRAGIEMLHTGSDWWLGKGLGRFPASYLFGAPAENTPGSSQLTRGPPPYLTLAGPYHSANWGDFLRVAQRVSPSNGPYTVLADVRAKADVQLHVEVCEQHLLYNGACLYSSVPIAAKPDWQQISLNLAGGARIVSDTWIPKLAFFSVAIETSGRSLDLRRVELIGADGADHLSNGDFHDGMARWTEISERFHLPWHIKNIALNLLFDQGLLGLGAFSLLLAMCMWRLALGAARKEAAAPFLAASIVGFICVGAFDSLLDVPRIAFLFYLLILTSAELGCSDVRRQENDSIP